MHQPQLDQVKITIEEACYADGCETSQGINENLKLTCAFEFCVP